MKNPKFSFSFLVLKLKNVVHEFYRKTNKNLRHVNFFFRKHEPKQTRKGTRHIIPFVEPLCFPQLQDRTEAVISPHCYHQIDTSRLKIILSDTLALPEFITHTHDQNFCIHTISRTDHPQKYKTQRHTASVPKIIHSYHTIEPKRYITTFPGLSYPFTRIQSGLLNNFTHVHPSTPPSFDTRICRYLCSLKTNKRPPQLFYTHTHAATQSFFTYTSPLPLIKSPISISEENNKAHLHLH